MKQTAILFAMATMLTVSAHAKQHTNDNVTDSTNIVDIEEIEIISTPKETGKLKQLPGSVTLLGQTEMKRHAITSLKETDNVVANLFIPDYGSHLTSAIYIRGIGSRINTPAVGLYVDNVPYFDKSAFDFSFYDIERIDVLRGPQGTLYGRNSMGGLIKIHTRSPFSYQGTDLKLGMASGDTHRHISLTHYHRISDSFAFNAGGYYDAGNGFFKNSQRNTRQDKQQSAGARIRAAYRNGSRLKADLSIAYDYSDEGGYPYFYLGVVNGDETHPELIDKISANEKSAYRRSMLNSGLNIEYRAKDFTLNAVTGFQHLNDRMFLDQDFIADNIYTLLQKQKLSILSQELTAKSQTGGFWEWVGGVSASKQWLTTNGPVTFKTDGINMLQNNINSYMPDLSANGMTMGVEINNPQIIMGGDFKTPLTNMAAFHQSTFNFNKHLSATLGVRLDYEHNSLTYDAPGSIDYNFKMAAQRMAINLDNLIADPAYSGKLSHNYVEVLPKTAFKYTIDKNNMIYVSAAKGHRSGGYNVQMFSDLLQAAMRNEMMSDIKNETNATLDRYAQMGMPQHIINMIKQNLNRIPTGETPNVDNTVTYKPEYSWNYELGYRSSLFDRRLNIDMSFFFTTIRNQQIARFAESGLGRMMVNAGRSRSWGLEANVKTQPTDNLTIWANYGFTHATFTHYDTGNNIDYSGKRVPFIPTHTLNVGTDYKLPLKNSKTLRSITLGANLAANGQIYWNESNTARQPFYATLGSHILFDLGKMEINLWGKNLTDKQYHAFYFESMNRSFAQKGKPLQVGFDINLKF